MFPFQKWIFISNIYCTFDSASAYTSTRISYTHTRAYKHTRIGNKSERPRWMRRCRGWRGGDGRWWWRVVALLADERDRDLPHTYVCRDTSPASAGVLLAVVVYYKYSHILYYDTQHIYRMIGWIEWWILSIWTTNIPDKSRVRIATSFAPPNGIHMRDTLEKCYFRMTKKSIGKQKEKRKEIAICAGVSVYA